MSDLTAPADAFDGSHLPHTESGARRFVTRIMLGTILGFTALNAIGGGIYGLLGAQHLPREWLTGTPFSSYLLPSLILLFAVGGSSALAAVAVFRRWRPAALISLAAALVLLGFVVAEVVLIGYVSFLQPVMVLVAKAILVLLAFEWRHLGPRVRRTG